MRQSRKPLIRAETNVVVTRDLEIQGIRKMEQGEEDRKFELTFSSEEPYERYFGPEILSHEPGAVDLKRLNTIGCVLFNHDRNKVIAKILKVWVDDNRGHAIIEFDKDEASEVIYQKVKSGTLKGVSVSYKVLVWEEVLKGAKSTDGRFKGPCYIAKKWMPTEISIVSVPADATVGVGRSMEEEEPSPTPLELCERQLQINQSMLWR